MFLYFYFSENCPRLQIYWSISISWVHIHDYIGSYFFSSFSLKFPNDLIGFFFLLPTTVVLSSPLILLQNHISLYFEFTILIFNFILTISFTFICLLHFWFWKGAIGTTLFGQIWHKFGCATLKFFLLSIEKTVLLVLYRLIDVTNITINYI